MTGRRWLFADQLGPHHLDGTDQPVLLVESRAVLRRRRFHRQKAHLVLSALRHRAAELGEQAVFLRAETYGEALERHGDPVTVTQPTSYAADGFVRAHPLVAEVLPDRGYATSREDFAAWVASRGRRRLLLEDFYRDTRRRHGVLMDGPEPAGGRWNLDADNREPPPRAATLGVTEPWWPAEDDIDAEVRHDLDAWAAAGDVTFVGDDGPRWAPATRSEAHRALRHFVRHRLPHFGPHEDAMLAGDWTMAHSLLSPAMNLGLLHPLEIARAADRAYRDGDVPLASAEGFVRQVLGWREYVWSLYWHLGPDYRHRNVLGARRRVPAWWWDLDAGGTVEARCLSTVLAELRKRGWVHHIPRLMVLGNYGLQRGFSPAELTEWFHLSFVDGYDWVMLANVVGMSQWADGGIMATKPYAAGGAYIDRMSDFCRPCRYDPRKRTGEDACPYTAGYWAFLHRNAGHLAGNPRMRQPLAGLRRLSDVDEVVAQEQARGTAAP
ncbi:MAG TPA: cryptochrome/photolyase family protein [Mycobacteriales bacterium]|nr:cryptochrome/photolyase family protein [Mycobacteriales bacterium]